MSRLRRWFTAKTIAARVALVVVIVVVAVPTLLGLNALRLRVMDGYWPDTAPPADLLQPPSGFQRRSTVLCTSESCSFRLVWFVDKSGVPLGSDEMSLLFRPFTGGEKVCPTVGTRHGYAVKGCGPLTGATPLNFVRPPRRPEGAARADFWYADYGRGLARRRTLLQFAPLGAVLVVGYFMRRWRQRGQQNEGPEQRCALA